MINATLALHQICMTGKSDEIDYLYAQNREAHAEPDQTSNMELFANIVIAWKPLIIFVKSSILDTPKYTWALNTPLEYQQLLDANVQGKVNTNAKIKRLTLQDRRCIL